MSKNTNLNTRGFTIVELLIVIVVIAILAAISIVAYSGIQNRAKTTSGQSLAGQIAKKVEAYNTIQSGYPTHPELVNNYDIGTTTASTKTQEAKLDDSSAVVVYASGTGANQVDNSATYDSGKKVVYRQTSASAGGCLYYWDFTLTTPAKASLKIGTGTC